MEFIDKHLVIPIVRVSPKQSATSALDPFAVRVAVTNQVESIGELSVGKVERHAMAEFWFSIDNKNLSEQQNVALSTFGPITETTKRRLTLYDQERSPIRSNVDSR
jgi:hypothetical protein